MLEKVHQNVAAKFIVGGVKRPSPIDFGDLFDEGIVGSFEVESESIDRDIGFRAPNDLRHRESKRLRDRRVAELGLAPPVDVGRGLSVGHHDDLLGAVLARQHGATQREGVLQVGAIDVIPHHGR